MRAKWELFIGGALAAAQTLAAGPVWKPVVDLRSRGELFETPAASATADRNYGLVIGRVRGGLEISWSDRVTLRGVAQAAAIGALPDDAVFGAGLAAYATNGGDRSPEQLGLAELVLGWKSDRFSLGVGRQAFADGAGPSTGIAHLDAVRSRRLAERLVGNLEFSNVARRFDGVTFSTVPGAIGTFEGFALSPLGGALNYGQAFDRLDIEVFGLAWSSAHGQLVPGASIRCFAQRYQDDRPVARRSTGGDLRIETFGASALAGDAVWNVLAWGAVQRGDYGARDHAAWAWVLDVGRRFPGVPGEPALHFGWERASGGGGGGENGNFWNVLPTNHKFYGALDYFALSNLNDLFLELRWSPSKPVKIGVALHDFRLVDRSGPWVGGSGPFSDRELGYTARRPPSGRYASSRLGRELDGSVSWTLPRGFVIQVEGGLFRGDDAAAQVLSASADGRWAALEVSYRR